MALFLAGLGGVIHETVVADVPDESLLVLFGAMMGLPFVFRHDKPVSDQNRMDWRKAPIRNAFPDGDR